MTVVLAIAVLILIGLVLALVLRREETVDPGEQAKAVAADAVQQLLAQNRELRERDQSEAVAALQRREAEIKGLAEKIKDGQERIEREVTDLSKTRRTADGAMRSLLDEMKLGLNDLGTQTGTLVKALRQPQTRGKWGEVQLKRCVEIAGMTEHVDFELQQTLRTEESILRPDAVVMLPGGRRVVIDSKVPLDAYLEALEAEDDASRSGELLRHARQVRDHIAKLSSKRYQDQFAGETPDFVICFMPSEAALHASFEADGSLYDYALEQKILIATPTTLVGLLRTVELGWRQETLAKEAQEIADAAREMHNRFGAFLPHLAKVGRGLSSAVGAYNEAVGSAEGRVMPQLRRIEELRAASGKELEVPAPIDQNVRGLKAEELPPTEGANRSEVVRELPGRAESDAA